MSVASRDRPEREGGFDPEGLAEAERQIAATLRRRIHEITESWHQELLAELKIRPQAIFPGSELLDHMPLVVRHVISFIEANEETPEDALAALRALADHWRDAGYAVEESLVHFRILNRVLHEELRTVIEALDPLPSGAHVARIAESLSHGSTLVQAVVVGSYRDREEERFGQYASTLSHEIRGPLASALTAIQTLDLVEQREPEERREELRHEALERLERTLWQIRDVLDAVTSVVVPGQHSEKPPEQRPLHQVVSAVVEEFRRNQDEVVVEQVGEIPAIAVPYDPILLALHNLVQNAVAYSDPEKLEQWVRISCEYDEEQDWWLLRVRDNGVGIPESEQQLIFRRFRRGRAARGKGFGLGLSIVRDAARRVNGEVAVESQPGEGSTFTFAFPASETQPLSPAQ